MDKNLQPLDKTLRNQLERTIRNARDIAEAAAQAALEQLGVGEAMPFAHLSEQDRELRRRLRVHGRQLGDLRHTKTKFQEIHHLIEKVAYEHWHRMLFARFLAENNLLMYPDPNDPVAVTLEECQDLATDEGVANGWELAARFAARMLPQIFQLDSPVFELVLPAGAPTEAGTPSGRHAAGNLHCHRQPRLGLSILASKKEGQGQRFRGQNRRTGATLRDPAFHRALHG